MNKNIPNILTVIRVVLVPFFIYSFLNKAYLMALIIFVVASLTDLLDGYLARKYDIVSNFGKFMDPLADKILTSSAFCLFVFTNDIPVIWFIIILTREFVVSGIRMLAASQGKVIPADIFGKIKTDLQDIGICAVLLVYYLNVELELNNNFALHTLPVIADIILGLSVIATIISGILYLIRNWYLFK